MGNVVLILRNLRTILHVRQSLAVLAVALLDYGYFFFQETTWIIT